MFKCFVREGEWRRWAPWAGSVLLILLAVALETSLESVCWDEKAADAAKINEVAGCLEFWTNRYQTLIGAFAALIAGYAAWRGAMNQVAKADAQIVVVSKQLAIDRIEYINAKLTAIDALHTSIFRFQIFSDQAVQALRSIVVGAEDICRIIDDEGNPVGSYNRNFEPATVEFERCLQAMQSLAANINSFQDNIIIPDIIRGFMPLMSSDVAYRCRQIGEYRCQIKSNTSIHGPGFDAVKVEFDRIASVRNNMPRNFNIMEHAVFLNIKAERDRLVELRRSAEKAAEI